MNDGWAIQRSDDGGHAWTEPRDARSGMLLKGAYHSCPVPVLIHGGRLWRALEKVEEKGSGKTPSERESRYRAMMSSVSLDADWLHAENWTFSDPVSFPFDHWQGLGWLEGNPVVTPRGDLVNIIRIENEGADKAAVLQCSSDGTKLHVAPESGMIDFPGGQVKFTIRYDPKSKKYWTLSNRQNDPPAMRNVLVLACSDNLRRWEVRTVVFRHRDRRNHAWQYADWQFEGDANIVFVSRTAWDGARNWHDANYVTFHRLENFRELTGDNDAPWLGDYETLVYEDATWKIEMVAQKNQAVVFGTFEENGKVFENRKFSWKNVPDRFAGCRFLRGYAGKMPIYTITAKESSDLYLLHPPLRTRSRNRYSQWTAVEAPSLCYSGSEQSGMLLSRRSLMKGESITLPLANSYQGEMPLFPRESKCPERR